MAEPTPDYRVVYTGLVREQFLKWSDRITAPELRQRLADAVKAIEQHLATAPLEWGESAHDLRFLGLTVFDGFEARIHVRYAVDEDRRIVYVVACRLLSDNPFGLSS